jgi:hypothetical protein
VIHDLTIHALDRVVICGSQAPNVLHEYREPPHSSCCSPSATAAAGATSIPDPSEWDSLPLPPRWHSPLSLEDEINE